MSDQPFAPSETWWKQTPTRATVQPHRPVRSFDSTPRYAVIENGVTVGYGLTPDEGVTAYNAATERSGRDAVYVTPVDQTLDVLARSVQDGGALLDVVKHLEDVHGWEAFEGIYTVADARQQHAFDHWGNADTGGHAHGPDDALPVGAPPSDDQPLWLRTALDQQAADKARLDALHDGPEPTSTDAAVLDHLATLFADDQPVNGADLVDLVGSLLRKTGRLA